MSGTLASFRRQSLRGLTTALVLNGMLASAAPPGWWNEEERPVINSDAAIDNHGVANIGQAKWMAKNALEALRAVLPDTANLVEADLVGPGKPIASWDAPAPEDREKQRAPLLLGQLKAIAAPFYERLYAVAPQWIASEKTHAGLPAAGTFPWSAATADDSNKSMALIGQLKAVFSLDFAADREEGDLADEIPDLWEYRYFGHFNFGALDDTDGDGVSNAREYALKTSPLGSGIYRVSSVPAAPNVVLHDASDNGTLIGISPAVPHGTASIATAGTGGTSTSFHLLVSGATAWTSLPASSSAWEGTGGGDGTQTLVSIVSRPTATGAIGVRVEEIQTISGGVSTSTYGDSYFYRYGAEGMESSRSLTSVENMLGLSAGELDPYPKAASGQGLRWIFSSLDRTKLWVVDQSGSVQKELPAALAEADWSSVNDLGHAVFNVNGTLTFWDGSSFIEHELPAGWNGADVTISRGALTQGDALLVQRPFVDPVLGSIIQYRVLDCRTGVLTILNPPSAAGSYLPVAAMGAAHVVGSGTKAWLDTALIEDLPAKGAGLSPGSKISDLHWAGITPVQVADNGRLTLEIVSSSSERAFVQLIPDLDADDDEIPDDLEKDLAEQLLATEPDPGAWGGQYSDLAQGNLDPLHDYTGEGTSARELATAATAIKSPSSKGILLEYQRRSNEITWGYSWVYNNAPVAAGLYSHSVPSNYDLHFDLDSIADLNSAYLTSRINGVAWGPMSVPKEVPWDPLITALYMEGKSGFRINPAWAEGVTSYHGHIYQAKFRIKAPNVNHENLAFNYFKITATYPYAEDFGPGTIEEAVPATIQIPKGKLYSGWTEFKADMTDGLDRVVRFERGDLDVIKPGTERWPTPDEIFEEDEDFVKAHDGVPSKGGEVVNVNWDDDDNSAGSGGHGKLVFKNDFDDAGPTPAEDDMIQLKLHKPPVNCSAKLKYDAAFVRIWKNADRTDEIVSNDTVINLTADTIVYLEGKALTEAEKPTEVEMYLKPVGGSSYGMMDKVSIHVATPVITCHGKHMWTNGQASENLARQLKSKQYLGKDRRDDRENTVILKGKDQRGRLLWYSVDMVDLVPTTLGNPITDKPLIKVRAPHLDKEMKMALSLKGAHVFYNGHSNYGLGPNFNAGDTTTVDDYLNLSGRGVTAICLFSDDPADAAVGGNPMKSPDHGGATFALRPADPVDQITNYVVPVPGITKFSGKSAGAVLNKAVENGIPYHYKRQGEHLNWITIVNSTGDRPALNYASCFMASCDTGRHFSETLTHGVLLYSMVETYGIQGGQGGQIPGDLQTGGYSWGMTQYVRLLTEGKSWGEITEFFNKNQYFMEKPVGNNYRFKKF